MMHRRPILLLCLHALAFCVAFGQGTPSSVEVDNTFKNTTNGYEWKVFIKEDQRVLDAIQCVEYRLDPTLENPIRKSCDPATSFAISGTSWTEFGIVLQIAWKDNKHTIQSYALILHRLPSLTLKNSFIEQYKDRATIETKFIVDVVGKIHMARTDGDGVVAGRSNEIGLPVVAEIMNAKFERETVKNLEMLAGEEKAIKITGAWRIWWEHPGVDPQRQGRAVPHAISSNPDHFFEIHPVTKFEEKSLAHTFAPIASYTPHHATSAFSSYEKNRCTITFDAATTTVAAYKTGYNYVEFVLRLIDVPNEVMDGTIALADVEDIQNELLVQRLRMIFVSDTEPERRVKNLHPGDRLHVLGVPRINLSAISQQQAKGKTVTTKLPYEMIIVAVMD